VLFSGLDYDYNTRKALPLLIKSGTQNEHLVGKDLERWKHKNDNCLICQTFLEDI